MYENDVVCLGCNATMQIGKSGVLGCEVADTGPYQVWYGDVYVCPICGCQVIKGWGAHPIAYKHDKDFHKNVERANYFFGTTKKSAQLAKILQDGKSRDNDNPANIQYLREED